MSTSRIPTTIPEFNSYINTSDDYLQLVVTPTNPERLGLSTHNANDWHNARLAWTDLYKKYTDPLQCTSTVRKDVTTAIKNFRAFANPLLNIVASSPNAIQDDADVFNFVLVRKTPTHRTTPISEKCNPILIALGGGKIKVKCVTDTESSRASLPEDADSVQIAYTIGDTAPANAAAAAEEAEFTKASFIIDCGTDNIGKKLFVFVRWYDVRHPELAGTWSSMQSKLIS